MRNLLITLSYDGARYHGWQIQENALTVQEVFQGALEKVTGGGEDIKACSRTDTGVHAREFAVSLKTESRIPVERLPAALNRYLPADMAVKGCRVVPEGFHARYSCRGKEYGYEIWNHPVRDPFLYNRALHYWYPLDEGLLDEAAAFYVGAHDFTSFCTLDSRDAGDFTRRVTKARVERVGDKVILRWRRTGSCITWCALWWAPFCGCSRGRCGRGTYRAYWRRGTGGPLGLRPRPAGCI